MNQIRRCTPDDLPGVAELYHSVFRRGKRMSTSAFSSYLNRIYFQNPWYDPEVSSRVFVSPDGKVEGFFGIMAMRMVFAGEPLRTAVGCSLMADLTSGEAFAGARLLRSVMKGPQHLTIGDSVNAIGRRLHERLGGCVSPLDSLDWFRVLRPASFLVTRTSDRVPMLPARAFLPFATWADRALLRLSSGLAIQLRPQPGLHVDDVSDEAFAEAAPRLLDSFAIHPDWSESDWSWWLAELKCKERYGTLNRCLVRKLGSGEVAGGFLYFSRQRDVAHLIQVLALPGMLGSVVDIMMAHVVDQGCAAIRGRTQPLLISELFRYGCTFRHRASAMFYTNQPALKSVLSAGGTLIGGPVGEAWTRWNSDDFEDSEVQPGWTTNTQDNEVLKRALTQ